MPDHSPTESRVEANLLDVRARRLAERPVAAVVPEARDPILIFCLGRERFAIRLKFIASIVPFERVTPVPTSGPDVLGVMAVRGEVHAVYALDRILELPRAAIETLPTDGHVLALRHVGRQIGVRVDRVEMIDEIPRAEAAAGATRVFVTPAHSAPLILIENLESILNPSSRGEDQ